MEQGLINTSSSSDIGISNLNDINTQNEYVLTRNNNNQVVVTEGQERIASLNTVTQDNEFILTRNNNNQLRVAPAQERIGNLNGIQNNTRYHLTRNNQEVTVLEDNSVQIAIPQTGNLLYAVRRQGNNAFSMTRVPNIIEYVFTTNNLIDNARFDILGVTGSRCVSVVNSTGKLIKIGILHVTQQRTNGLIDRNYSFELIINNINQTTFVVNYPGGGPLRTLVQDIENLNYFLNEGDSIGLRYVPTGNHNTGNYCEVRLTLDTNARNDNFGGSNIP